MADEIYWIWLQETLGACSRAVKGVIELGGARRVFSMTEEELRLSGKFSAGEVFRLQNRDLDGASTVLMLCANLGYGIITPGGGDYNDKLLALPDPPAALYVCGRLPDMSKLRIGVVGTRDAEQPAVDRVYSISAALAGAGAVIVSGCARGIDAAAHSGALAAGGKTLGILGCGIDTDYNRATVKLRRLISKNGALISEYPPGTPAVGFRFPQRNRLIAALSDGLFVGQAGNRSGSLITAGLAAEQGVTMFADAAFEDAPSYAGTQQLLHEGALPVSNAGDILAQFRDRGVELNKEKKPPQVEKNLSRMQKGKDPLAVRRDNLLIEAGEDAKRLYGCFPDGEAFAQELAAAAGMELSRALSALTMLELFGVVESVPGNRYKKLM